MGSQKRDEKWTKFEEDSLLAPAKAEQRGCRGSTAKPRDRAAAVPTLKLEEAKGWVAGVSMSAYLAELTVGGLNAKAAAVALLNLLSRLIQVDNDIDQPVRVDLRVD